MARPKFTAELIQDLRLRVIRHNEAYPNAATRLGDLKKQYERGYRGADPGGHAMDRVEAYLAELTRKAEADPSGRVPSWVGVPLSSLPVYEAGAILFAYLAFPGTDADVQRGEAQVAMCNLALHAMAQRDPASMWVPQLIKPGHLIFPKWNVNRVLRSFDGLLRDRFVAATMAMPLLGEAELGAAAEKLPGVTRLSISQLANFATDFSGEGSPVNVQGRVWAPSLPVIHLAVATAVAISLAQKSGAKQLDVHVLCCSPDFVRFVVQEAERYEALLPLAPKLQLALERLVRFRLT